MVTVTNYGDVLCNWCILVMEQLSELSGLSYGLINILFFCVFGPLSTLCFMGATATAYFGKNRIIRKNLTLLFSVLGIVCVLAVILPCLWGAVTLELK